MNSSPYGFMLPDKTFVMDVLSSSDPRRGDFGEVIKLELVVRFG